MGWIITLIVGALIGWIASLIMKTDAQQGTIANILQLLKLPDINCSILKLLKQRLLLIKYRFHSFRGKKRIRRKMNCSKKKCGTKCRQALRTISL